MKKESNKLASVCEILGLIEKKFELAYTPAEYTAIDRQLILFGGRYSF